MNITNIVTGIITVGSLALVGWISNLFFPISITIALVALTFLSIVGTQKLFGGSSSGGGNVSRDRVSKGAQTEED